MEYLKNPTYNEYTINLFRTQVLEKNYERKRYLNQSECENKN